MTDIPLRVFQRPDPREWNDVIRAGRTRSGSVTLLWHSTEISMKDSEEVS
jgi:hypothetical protein